MKWIIIIAILCMINILYAGSKPKELNIKYTAVLDTLTPPGSNSGYNPTNMQPVSPSTVNGNNTPVLPDTNNTRHSGIDTSHIVH